MVKSWPEHKRDIYTAHEIAQLLPLFQRDETYQNFIKNNTWINTILINCQNEQSIFLHNKGKIDYQILRILGGFFFSPVFEGIMHKIQGYYIKKNRTNEEVTKTILAFHPKDYRVIALSILRSKCQELGLLTKF